VSFVIWLPLITTLIAAITGAIVYSVQRAADRKNNLIAKRREAYENYLIAYLNASSGSGLDPIAQRLAINKSRMTLRLIGSDAVITSAASLDEYAIRTSIETGIPRDGREYKRLLAAVVLAMRSDVFETTRLSLDEMKSSLPISDT
jgi:hypothetical protein